MKISQNVSQTSTARKITTACSTCGRIMSRLSLAWAASGKGSVLEMELGSCSKRGNYSFSVLKSSMLPKQTPNQSLTWSLFQRKSGMSTELSAGRILTARDKTLAKYAPSSTGTWSRTEHLTRQVWPASTGTRQSAQPMTFHPTTTTMKTSSGRTMFSTAA